MACVLLVEDDLAIAQPLARALRREGHDVDVRGDGLGALARVQAGGVDLLVLDIGLPGLDGLEVCRRLRATGCAAPVLVLTARTEEVDAVVGLDAGADDYVTKPFRLGELLARVRALLRRGALEPAPVAGPATGSPTTGGSTTGAPAAGRPVTGSPVTGSPATGGPSPGSLITGLPAVRGVQVDAAARRAWHDGVELTLTAKEFDLLRVLVASAGSVVRREDLMREVWDTQWFGATRTLDMHVSWLRRKLGDTATDSRYITTVRGVGFRFER